MIPNKECLMLQMADQIVLPPCRDNPNYYPGKDRLCRLAQCEAREVIEDPAKRAVVVGPTCSKLFGQVEGVTGFVYTTVFHDICPGTNNPQGGYENYLKLQNTG